MNNLGNGLMLALAGALLLTPDTLLMRLSGLDGGAMLAWRACLAGLVMIHPLFDCGFTLTLISPRTNRIASLSPEFTWLWQLRQHTFR